MYFEEMRVGRHMASHVDDTWQAMCVTHRRAQDQYVGAARRRGREGRRRRRKGKEEGRKGKKKGKKKREEERGGREEKERGRGRSVAQ